MWERKREIYTLRWDRDCIFCDTGKMAKSVPVDRRQMVREIWAGEWKTLVYIYICVCIHIYIVVIIYKYVQAIVFCAILLVECNQISVSFFFTLIDLNLRLRFTNTFHSATFLETKSLAPECTERAICSHDNTLTRCDKFICSYNENKRNSLMETCTSFKLRMYEWSDFEERRRCKCW